MGILGTLFADFLENIYYDSYGFASRAGGYEPEMTEDKAEYKKAHISKLEKLYTKLAR